MKKIIKATAFALVVAFCLALATDFLSMTDREDTMHVRGYFEEPNNSIDVLMIGASELYTGFSSPLAWKKYGFTSYALSYSGAQGSLYKTMLGLRERQRTDGHFRRQGCRSHIGEGQP